MKQTTPATEVCNNKDDDCNGLTDDGISCPTSAWTVTSIAGSTKGYKDDIGNLALFDAPYAIAEDSKGNLYIADFSNNRIRKMTPAGQVTTFAGSSSGFKDGQGTAAQFNNPTSIAIDKNDNLYVVDSFNYRIRKIDPSGNVTTIAGSSTSGSKNGPALQAQFIYPHAIVIDSKGNLFITDADDDKVRKLDTTGQVTTFAGSTRGYKDGQGTSAQLSEPYAITIDSKDNLYIADTGTDRIRKIDPQGKVTTFAGSGTGGFKDGQGTAAQFSGIIALTIDPSDNVYVADTENHRIRIIDPTGNVTTLAGDGTKGNQDGQASSAQFNRPHGLYFAKNGSIYIPDTDNHLIRELTKRSTSAAGTTTFAGSSQGNKDGQGTAAQFSKPHGVTIDNAGNLFIADTDNHTIRKIDSQGNVTTFAGSGTAGYKDDKGTAAQFNLPKGMAFDNAGNLYIADSLNHRIRKIDSLGNVTTFVGSTQGYKDGQGTAAQLDRPSSLTIDAAGNLFVTDSGNNRIRQITPQGNVTTFAGSGTFGFKDGQGVAAQFGLVDDITITPSGDLYVADTSNHKIRKIDSSANVTSFAGSGISGYKDDKGIAAQFYLPGGITSDNVGNLYISESGNSRIRKVDPQGNVTTIAGDGTFGFKDGPNLSAQFALPYGIAVDKNGHLFVAEGTNHKIRKIIP